jgi:hypothetical protein
LPPHQRINADLAGFLVYGVGLGGSLVLQEIMWATYYGRASLGAVRGLGMLITLTFGAAGAPFFGFIFDATGSYAISFITFALALLVCAWLTFAPVFRGSAVSSMPRHNLFFESAPDMTP